MTAPFSPRNWALAHGKSLVLGPKAHLMGVINATPDSFSDGGQFQTPNQAVEQASVLFADGASIIDIGAESTKPGAVQVEAAEEQTRLLPVLKAVLQALPDVVLSVDTYRASTAEQGLLAGAHIVNDVWGLQKEPDLAKVAAEHGAGLVIMHTNREREALDDIIDDQKAFFGKSLEIATRAGVKEEHIVLDPGFGFGKESADINLQLMRRMDELHSLGFPLLIGTSRKRFLGTVSGREPEARDVATAASSALLRQKGGAVFRVHNVAINADALKVCDAMLDA